MVAPMSCTNQSVFCCILPSFALQASPSPPPPPTDHGSMSRLMFGLTKAATQDDAEDEAEVCVLCCQKRSTFPVCDECKEHYCIKCIDTRTCGTNVVC